MKVIECRGPNCKQKIVFLQNAETGRTLPVNYDSLTMDEVKGLNNGVNVLYNKVHHIHHHKVCPDVEMFTKKRRSKFKP